MSVRHLRASFRRRRHLLATVAFGLPAALTAGVVEAQDGDDGARVIEEVTVTARRTEENLQEVPVTVTAIGGETLEKYLITQVSDIQSRVPALTIQVGGSGAGASVNLRGVGSSAISAAFDSAVAFDIDGVQVSSGRLVQAAFFDTAQIDVLKGPQTLFFGKSATAGVISLKSLDPTEQWEFGIDGGYEFEENGTSVSGFASGPITETLGIRVAGYASDIDRFQRSSPGTFAENTDRGLEDYVGRLTLAWNPTERFNANLKGTFVRNENDGANQFRDIDCGPNGVSEPVIFGFGGASIPSNADCDTGDSRFPQVDSDPITRGGLAPPTNRGASRFAANDGLAFGLTELYFTRLNFDFDLTKSLTLSSTTGYVDFESLDRDAFSFVGTSVAVPLAPGGALAPGLASINQPGVGLGLGSNLADNQTRQFTQELRLFSQFDGPLNFQLGAFYQNREIEFNTAEQAFNVAVAFGAATGGGIGFDYQREHFTNTDAYSAFGSVTYDIGNQLTLTAGLRYTREEKDNTIAIPFINPIIAGLDLDGDGVSNFVQSGFQSDQINFEDDDVSPEVSLVYRATDNVNFFAAFKTGFKSGGIDTSALPGVGLAGIGNQNIDPATGQTFDSAATAGLLFDSETAIGGEIGIKSQLLERALQLNATAYYYVYDDLQVQQFDGVAVQFATFNAGELTTFGLDVDFTYLTPVDGLSITGSLAYLDSSFTDEFLTIQTDENGDPIDLDGRDAALAPSFSGNIAADWYFPLAPELEMGLNVNVAYAGDQFTGNSPFQLSQDAYATVDANISIGHPDGRWRAALVASNIGDEQIITNSGNRPFTPAGADDNVVTLNRGRQVTMNLSLRF